MNLIHRELCPLHYLLCKCYYLEYSCQIYFENPNFIDDPNSDLDENFSNPLKSDTLGRKQPKHSQLPFKYSPI